MGSYTIEFMNSVVMLNVIGETSCLQGISTHDKKRHGIKNDLLAYFLLRYDGGNQK